MAKNRDASEALSAARRGACAAAVQHYDRALRIDLHGKNALDMQGKKSIGLVIVKHCARKAPTAIKRVKFYAGLSGAGKRRAKRRR